MSRLEKAARIGTGVEGDEFRPDTTANRWQVAEEHQDYFIIEVFDEEPSVDEVE